MVQAVSSESGHFFQLTPSGTSQQADQRGFGPLGGVKKGLEYSPAICILQARQEYPKDKACQAYLLGRENAQLDEATQALQLFRLVQGFCFLIRLKTDAVGGGIQSLSLGYRQPFVRLHSSN